ncbi:glycerophosphodiester phosphodiesterase family protein [Pseudooceanicola sp. LIPI14-2-Ac024]|uniref:glycerophosphodiester phosphodiesterase family protein n=1 Tax=Pseudooceanicola sp. LIPI14-2-Ac024 TaxID=3344875 RepID=UPI0035CF50B9
MFRTFVTGVALATALAGSSLAATFSTLDGNLPLVIAHRGASGYLPEHTLAAYELAIKMGADIVEPDLQQTSDGHLVAMHDSTLTRTTDVEAKFAPRNGGYKVSDFTLAEIRSLVVEPTASTASNSYPGYTPTMANPFQVPTFEEVMQLVNAHNAATGANIGIYPEAKTPNSTAMNQKILDEMKANGFESRSDLAFIQTFDHAGAKELSDLQDAMGMDNAIAALGYAMSTVNGYGVYDAVAGVTNLLTDLALFADGVGVSLSSPGLDAGFIQAAHDLGLVVHGWTFNRADPASAYAQYEQWLDAGMDGFFTNYTDLAVDYLAAQVPLPAGLPLLAGGLGAIAVVRRRRRAA